MTKIFFTSDYHIGHSNILRLCNRPFSDVDEMEKAIIRNHNYVVSKNDEVWDLGDIAFKCSPQHIANFLGKLNGKRRIILGNHDKSLRQAYQKGLLKELICNDRLSIIGGEAIIYDNTLDVSKTIFVNGQKIYLGHYSHRSWPSAFRNVWHLFGHSHGNLEAFFKSFDVGVDGHNFFPWEFNEIKTVMDAIKNPYHENPSQIAQNNPENQENEE